MQEKLIILRKKHKDTAKKIASLINVSAGTYALKESDMRPFTLNESLTISKYYELPIEEIFHFQDIHK